MVEQLIVDLHKMSWTNNPVIRLEELVRIPNNVDKLLNAYCQKHCIEKKDSLTGRVFIEAGRNQEGSHLLNLYFQDFKSTQECQKDYEPGSSIVTVDFRMMDGDGRIGTPYQELKRILTHIQTVFETPELKEPVRTSQTITPERLAGNAYIEIVGTWHQTPNKVISYTFKLFGENEPVAKPDFWVDYKEAVFFARSIDAHIKQN